MYQVMGLGLGKDALYRNGLFEVLTGSLVLSLDWTCSTR